MTTFIFSLNKYKNTCCPTDLIHITCSYSLYQPQTVNSKFDKLLNKRRAGLYDL